jgi:hypothetical protein
MSISFFQRGVLGKIRINTDTNGCSHYVGPSRTRDALVRMGLIERRSGPGSGYIITDAGRLELDGPVTRDTYGEHIATTFAKPGETQQPTLIGSWPVGEPIVDPETLKSNAWASDIIKTCGCGKTYTKLTWKLLDFVSYFDDDEPADPEHPEWGEPQGRLEQRNCECGSTIAVVLKKLEEP